MPAWPDWSAAAHLELMDRTGIDTAVLSVSSPGTHFGDAAAARRLAREVNDAGAQLVHHHPGRFGLFASLPLPDTDGALAELGYALDTLGADGVIVETNAHGVYLGDQRLEPVFAELARRRATVLVHPTSPPCWQQTALGRPRLMIEFIFDTARAVTGLILTGTLTRHPGMNIIVPHGGGALPLLADRIATEPKFVVLDEPTSALDMSIRAQILDLLLELQREQRFSYLFISHDLTTVQYSCDNVAVMYLGRIVEYGPAAQVFADPKHPFTKALLSAMLLPDVDHVRAPLPLPGEPPSAITIPPGCAFAPRCPFADRECLSAVPPLRPVDDRHRAACIRVDQIGQLRQPPRRSKLGGIRR
jgi:oligopeptide/dipeptide ABC transporter ATP-binding protein